VETSNEIRSAVNNIRYYSKQIEELAKKQFERDFEIGQVTGMNSEPGSIRFECLGAIGAAAHWFGVYCDNIEANLKGAESQDQKLRPLPEEQEESNGENEAIMPEKEFK